MIFDYLAASVAVERATSLSSHGQVAHGLDTIVSSEAVLGLQPRASIACRGEALGALACGWDLVLLATCFACGIDSHTNLLLDRGLAQTIHAHHGSFIGEVAPFTSKSFDVTKAEA